jgi:hypothetical protein
LEEPIHEVNQEMAPNRLSSVCEFLAAEWPALRWFHDAQVAALPEVAAKLLKDCRRIAVGLRQLRRASAIWKEPLVENQSARAH